MEKTTKKMIEGQFADLKRFFPGQEITLESVNYQNPSRRYCVMLDGVELTRWLLAGEIYEALRAMANTANAMRRNFDNDCAGCGDRINIGGVE